VEDVGDDEEVEEEEDEEDEEDEGTTDRLSVDSSNEAAFCAIVFNLLHL
jgi:hypothetical protein